MTGAGGEAETLDELRQREADDWAADQETVSSSRARRVSLPRNFEERCYSIPRSTTIHIPAASAGRYAGTWAEAINGMLDGDEDWGKLAAGRARLLLGDLARTAARPQK